MTRTFTARFENGVLVPDSPLGLPEHKQVSLTLVEEDAPLPTTPPAIPRYDDPNDPMPEGGTAMLDWWARHRIVIDPAMARDIAESDEHLEQDSIDEP